MFCDSQPIFDEVPIIDMVLVEVLVFGPEGGSEDFPIFQDSECSVEETESGGADQVIGDLGSVSIESPGSYELEIINVFGDGTTTTTAQATSTTTTAGTPTTTAAAATAARATPRFTG